MEQPMRKADRSMGRQQTMAQPQRMEVEVEPMRRQSEYFLGQEENSMLFSNGQTRLSQMSKMSSF